MVRRIANTYLRWAEEQARAGDQEGALECVRRAYAPSLPPESRDRIRQSFREYYTRHAAARIASLARDAGWPSQAAVSLIQALVDLPEDMSPSTVRVWFVPERTPYFFWLIPHSPTQGAIGLIGKGARETRRVLAGFLQRNAQAGPKREAGD